MSKSTRTAKSATKKAKKVDPAKSRIARAAAKEAWKTMRSKAYLRAADKPTPAAARKSIDAYLASR